MGECLPKEAMQKDGLERWTSGLIVIAVLAMGLTGCASVPEKQRMVVPPRDPGFSFTRASEGSLEQFALGPTDDEKWRSFKPKMLRKYDGNGDGNLTPEEERKMRQDFFARRKRFIEKHDQDKSTTFSKREYEYQQYLMYQRRLKFMKKFDANNNGRLDQAETEAMRAELSKRQDSFFQNFEK
jgi:EF hand